jgi:serine/threonine-protein kinase
MNVRDIGAYFRGRDPAGAAASLLFAQGLFSDPPIVDKAKLGAESGALASLAKSTAGLELTVLEELIRDNGGRVVALDPTSGRGSVGLTFALGGPTRAQQAARALAKQQKLP